MFTPVGSIPIRVRQITVVGSKQMAVCDDLDLHQPLSFA